MLIKINTRFRFTIYTADKNANGKGVWFKPRSNEKLFQAPIFNSYRHSHGCDGSCCSTPRIGSVLLGFFFGGFAGQVSGVGALADALVLSAEGRGLTADD